MEGSLEKYLEYKVELLTSKLRIEDEILLLEKISELEPNLSILEKIEIKNRINKIYHKFRKDRALEIQKNQQTIDPKAKLKLVAEIKEAESKRNEIRQQRDKQNQIVKELFKKVNDLKDRRDNYNRLVKQHKTERDALKPLLRTDGNARIQQKEHHEKVVEYHNKSQEIHSLFVEILQKSKEARNVADFLHQEFLNKNKIVQDLRNKFDKL